MLQSSKYVLACDTASLDFRLANPHLLDWLVHVYRGGVINNPFDLKHREDGHPTRRRLTMTNPLRRVD